MSADFATSAEEAATIPPRCCELVEVIQTISHDAEAAAQQVDGRGKSHDPKPDKADLLLHAVFPDAMVER
jgi:hypothetical protein